MLYIFDKNESLISILKPDFSHSTGPASASQAFLMAEFPAEFDREPTEGCPYWDAVHREVLNGENTFQFTVPGNQADAEYIQEGNLVAFKDLDASWQFFEIKRLVDLHGDGLTRTAFCEHVLYELIDDIIEDLRPTDCSASFALTQALSGTRWEVGTVADLGLNSTNYYYKSAYSAVHKVASVWGGELQFRVVVTGGVIANRYVDLLVRRGADTGKQFAYGRHTIEIEREPDLTSVSTAMYGRGKGVEVGEGYGRRLDFGDVVWTVAGGDPADKPAGQEWVGDPDALAQWGRPGGRHRYGVFEDQEETDPAVLLQKTWDYLQERKTPRVTYRMSVVDLERLSGYDHEKVRLGDTARCLDRKFYPALLVSARVIEINRNLLQPADTKIALGNFAPDTSDDAKLLKKTNQVVSDRQGVWDRATQFNQDGTLNTSWLTGIINTLQNEVKAGNGTVTLTENNGILIVDNATTPTKALRLLGGLLAIANSKDVNGNWIWTTFGTGDGFDATKINTGQIQTSLVKIFGNTNFYWDGDYLYIINPDDLNQQIRLSKEGIRFTKDGGQTWLVAMDFDGVRMEGTSQDGYTHYTGDGTKVYDEAGNLVGHLGSFETLGDQLATFARASTAYKQDGSVVAAGVPRYEAIGDRLGILIEKATTNLVTSPKMQTDSNADGVVDGFSSFKRAEVTGTFSLDSAQKINIAANSYDTTNYLAYVTQIVTGFAGGDIVSISVKARTGGQDGVQAKLRCFALDSSNVSLGHVGVDVVTSSAAEADLEIANVTLPANTAKISVYLMFDVVTVGATGDVWFKYLQIEKKPQKTTFHDSSRVTDALTIPTSGVITPDNGTVEINAFVNPYTQNALGYVVGHATATAVGVGGWYPNFIGLYINQTGVVFRTSDTEGYSSSAIWGTALTVGLHKFTIAWDSTELVLLVDGVRRASVANPKLPTALAATFNVGGWISSGLEICTILNDLRVSSVKRSDEDDLAAYSSGLPLTVDDAVTLLMSCDGHLRPTVRKFGLWVGQGEVNSVIVKGSRIFGTQIRSGDEGDTSYIELGVGSYDPLTVVRNGKTALNIWAEGGGGTIQFYNIVANDMCGQILPFDDVSGTGIRLQGRTFSSGMTDISVDGALVDIAATSGINLEPGAGYVSVLGEFHVIGGPKDCAEQTVNYGMRLLAARESPEIRYIDEEKATLSNGECTITVDPIFLECIEPDTEETPWLIHLTPYADVSLYVAEVGIDYFVIRERNNGTSNSVFAWSLSAIRKNFANIRLREMIDYGVNTGD